MRCGPGQAQGREEAKNDHPQRRVTSGGLYVADWQGSVGSRQYGGRIVYEEEFLAATVEVSVWLSKSQAIGQKVGRLVVVGAVAGKRIAPLHYEDVGHPEN